MWWLHSGRTILLSLDGGGGGDGDGADGFSDGSDSLFAPFLLVQHQHGFGSHLCECSAECSSLHPSKVNPQPVHLVELQVRLLVKNGGN